MSGDTVTGQALQFTNDNKFAYAYSGLIEAVSGTYTTLLNFDTNSEYLDSKIIIQHAESTTDDLIFRIKFNGVIIMEHSANRVDLSVINTNYLPLLIPPFTNVLIEVINSSGTALRSTYATVNAEVGMAQRVGNLDD